MTSDRETTTEHGEECLFCKAGTFRTSGLCGACEALVDVGAVHRCIVCHHPVKVVVGDAPLCAEPTGGFVHFGCALDDVIETALDS